MSDEKWMSLAPDAPTGDAARHVLAARLAAVAARLRPAVENAAEDIEHVHQLRVASRRAAAALRLFRDCLPDTGYDAARKLVRDVRRAAGEARDWDVFAEFVRRTDRLTGPAFEPARAYLLGVASGCRAVAQTRLRAAADGHGVELADVLSALPEQARTPDSFPTAGALAAAQLAELFDEFNALVASRPRTGEELHRLRIAAKRLRYALEVFAGCFPPALREAYYPAVEAAQTVLGRVNDALAAADRLGAIRAGVRKVAPTLAPAVRPGLGALIAGVKADAADGKYDFRRWEREWALLLVEYPLPDVLRPAAAAVPV